MILSTLGPGTVGQRRVRLVTMLGGGGGANKLKNGGLVTGGASRIAVPSPTTRTCIRCALALAIPLVTTKNSNLYPQPDTTAITARTHPPATTQTPDKTSTQTPALYQYSVTTSLTVTPPNQNPHALRRNKTHDTSPKLSITTHTQRSVSNGSTIEIGILSHLLRKYSGRILFRAMVKSELDLREDEIRCLESIRAPKPDVFSSHTCHMPHLPFISNSVLRYTDPVLTVCIFIESMARLSRLDYVETIILERAEEELMGSRRWSRKRRW